MKNGPVQVGYGFHCTKHNGKEYSGYIRKVAAYDRGTLVTITFAVDDGCYDALRREELQGYRNEYRSIYLEDCKEWHTEQPVNI